MTLLDFLREGASKPLVWGACDCSLWPADWVLTSRGVDPAADLRGTYLNRRAALAVIRRAGGLPWLFGPRAEAVGMHVVAEARAGDVGVVRSPAGLVGAIRTDDGWAVKRERGVIVAPFAPVLAWGFGDG